MMLKRKRFCIGSIVRGVVAEGETRRMRRGSRGSRGGGYCCARPPPVARSPPQESRSGAPISCLDSSCFC
ncbi:unnamed protein product [Tuber melanosporum]|uniref:(Perigord truffle) hypothetical protein n=1 Tax=Tuber melanosporum (strain Mel28) TaxID=656061 RepID=D5GBV8_TUBMM|nr:uncharacterized protein GSTUM_00005608001 [Tuber melanosporum]CAZ81958.1 unnamed protein product [Tuber melanosporum]